jgi:hypothetical protein
MNNHTPRTVLKVDATFIRNNNDSKVFVIYNINVPEHYLAQQQELAGVLNRIKDLLIQQFPPSSVVFQISASYILEHVDTGQTKTWTGSFFAKHNRAGLIADFLNFIPTTFVDTVLNNLQHVDAKLRWNGLDTKWKYKQLLSVIFNVQCTISDDADLFKDTPKRGTRLHKTFPVP